MRLLILMVAVAGCDVLFPILNKIAIDTFAAGGQPDSSLWMFSGVYMAGVLFQAFSVYLFFMQAGNLAARYGVHLALEANPPMYTNYLNGTADAFALVKRLDNPGLSVNLDLSTVLAQGEHLQSFIDDMQYVSHVHISEPGLVPIERRPEHKELALLLGAVGYRGFVSVEMAHTDVDTIRRTMDYIAEVFA